MKINNHQQKVKKNQRNSPQKTSFISITHTNPTKQRVSENLTDYQNFLGEKDSVYPLKRKDMEDLGFANPFGEDTESTRQFTRYQNYLSTQNLMMGVNPVPNQIKNVRQSENIYAFQTNKALPNSANDKKIASTKSATHIGPQLTPEFLNAKQSAHTKQKEQQSEQIKELMGRIKEAETLNEKIKQQNIQLRLIKLSKNSQSMQMLGIKLEIQDLKRKIDKIKNELKKAGEETFNQYYQDKKHTQQMQTSSKYLHPNSYNTPQLAKQRGSDMYERNASIGKNLGNPTVRPKSPFNVQFTYLSPLKPQMAQSPILIKQKYDEESRSIGQKKVYFSQRQIKQKRKQANEFNNYYRK